MRPGLLGAGGGVDAAEDHGHTASPIGVGDRVAPRRRPAVDADAHQVHGVEVPVEVDGPDDLVGVDDLVLGRGQRRQEAEPHARQRRGLAAHRRDQLDLHGAEYHGPGTEDR